MKKTIVNALLLGILACILSGSLSYQAGMDAQKAATQAAVSEAFSQGKEEGYDEGRNAGYDEGYDAGVAFAGPSSYEDGYWDGYHEGYEAWYDEAKADESHQSGSLTSLGNSSSSQQTSPQSQTVYITNTGEKYHRLGCQYLRQSCISISLNDAKRQGYTACSRCW